MNRRSFLGALGAAVLSGPEVRRLIQGRWPSHLISARSGSDLEALVLGTVQDAGLPQVGCYSERCERGRAAERPRYVSSLALVEPRAERFYLVDATPDITRQIDLIEHPAFRTRASARDPFDGIFLTHAHIGHYLGLAHLGNEGMGITGTPVYCTPAMSEFLRTNAPWSLMVDQGRIVPTPLAVEPTGAAAPLWHRIDQHLSVRLLQVPHRDEFADTVGFVFQGPERSLLFLPDIDQWDRWDRNVAQVVGEVDIALLDGSFYSGDEVPGRSVEEIPHPMIPSTMDLLQGVVGEGRARVLFTHLNNTNPALDEGGPEAAEVARRGFEVAREGMQFEL